MARKDPLPVFCFHVFLNINNGDKAEAFFKSVSGIKSETEIVPMREGGVNDTTWQLIGATKWANLVLKQGFTADSKLLEWRQQWLSPAADKRNRIAEGRIVILDTALKAKGTWTFVNGWPAKWELGELDASKSELSIETLEIAHEGITYKAGG